MKRTKSEKKKPNKRIEAASSSKEKKDMKRRQKPAPAAAVEPPPEIVEANPSVVAARSARQKLLSSAIPKELLPDIAVRSDAEIAEMEAEELGPLMTEVEEKIVKKRQEMEALAQYGKVLRQRFNTINARWNKVFADIIEVEPEPKPGREAAAPRRLQSPLQGARISVTHSFNWASRETPPWAWENARDRAMTNALANLKARVEDEKAGKAEPMVSSNAEILRFVEQDKLPPELEAYINKHQKSYEAKLLKMNEDQQSLPLGQTDGIGKHASA